MWALATDLMPWTNQESVVFCHCHNVYSFINKKINKKVKCNISFVTNISSNLQHKGICYWVWHLLLQLTSWTNLIALIKGDNPCYPDYFPTSTIQVDTEQDFYYLLMSDLSLEKLKCSSILWYHFVWIRGKRRR